MNTINKTRTMQVNVRVNGESESATKLNIRSGKFKMTIDEPENMGGTDDGPSPVQVILMALSGCLNVTGHHVAKERGLKLLKMEVQIDGMMNPCNFMGCSYDERAGFQKIKVNIKPKFENEISNEEINAWIEETEARCPVTDNIKEGTEILINNVGIFNNSTV